MGMGGGNNGTTAFAPAGATGGTSVGVTNPVAMQTSNTSQPVDSSSTAPDGGAAWLQSIMADGSKIGTQLLANNQAQKTGQLGIQLAQIKAQTQVSSTSMLIVAIVAGGLLWLLLRRE